MIEEEIPESEVRRRIVVLAAGAIAEWEASARESEVEEYIAEALIVAGFAPVRP